MARTDELTKAIWLEAVYSGGRFYNMSNDAIEPQASVVSRDYFSRIAQLGGFFEELGPGDVRDLEARAWIWRYARSINLTMEEIARAS